MHGICRRSADNKMHKFLIDNLKEYYFLDDYMYKAKMGFRKTILTA
jgi:hypothetical protein